MLKKLKKGICITLSAALAASCLAGCGMKKSASGEGELLFYVIGTEKGDTSAIIEQANAIIKDKTGYSVKFEYLNTDNYDLTLSSGDSFDLIAAPDYMNYWQNAAKGAFAEITDEDLKEYVPYYWKNADKEKEVTKYKGTRYGIAHMAYYAPDRCIAARGDLMDKYGIKSLDNKADVEKYLTAVAENEPDMIPFDMPGGSSYLMLAMFASDWGWAPVGSLSYGEHVYFKVDDPEHKLFIAAEQPEMLEFIKTMKRWNDKGFFSKSIMSSKTQSVDSFKAGRSAFALVNSPAECQTVYTDLQADERAKWDVRFFPRYEKQQQMYNFTNGIVAVSAFSKNKEAALKVVNEMYSNQEVYNLLHYGIKDKHYTLNDKNEITLLPEADNAGVLNTCIDNDAYTYTSELNFPGHEELVEKLKEQRVYNPAVNCPVSDEGIREIKLALTEIYSQYTAPLYYGIMTGTPEEELKKELSSLKAAGIDHYKEAVQSQLDEYMKSVAE